MPNLGFSVIQKAKLGFYHKKSQITSQCKFFASLMQVYTGSYKSLATKRHILGVSDLSGLREGHLVAINVAETNKQPSIAKCTKINGGWVDIIWMRGSYTSCWKPWTIRKGKKMVEWEDSIPIESIFLYDFDLTPNGHLRKQTINHIKSTYTSIEEEKS